MKDCNKKIYDKIQEYLDTCLTSSVEIVIEYKDDPGHNLHQVVQYNRTGSDTWLGVVGNMFDFDFFDCKEVVSFVPFCNLTATENTVVTVDEDDCFLCPPELLKPYKGIQSDNMEIETHRGYYTTEEDTTNKSKKVAWFTFLDNDFADKVELNLNDRELIQENGKWFVVKKKPTYPNNFDDCFNTVADELNDNKDIEYFEYKYDLLDKFKQLLICRDAYWKIAGEELELDKPWEPDYTKDEKKYCIGYDADKLTTYCISHSNKILAFPTEEMRDAFYVNFKDLIEQCKELL